MKLIKSKRVVKDATVQLVEADGRTAVYLSDASLQAVEVEVPAGMTAEALYEAM